jgi:hypothetical protein
MEKISIFNYEAYYLDFLEGNLNEEDTAVLMDFLKKHPELEIDGEEMQVLHTENIFLDKEFLKGMKQVDLVADQINDDSLEQFMIASIEGKLSEQKQSELNKILSANEKAAAEMALYKKTILSAPVMIFDGKEELKQKKTIVLWPYFAMAAAASLIAFLLWFGISTDVTKAPEYAKKQAPKIENSNDESDEVIVPEPQNYVANENGVDNEKKDFVKSDKTSPDQIPTQQKKNYAVDHIKTKTPGNLTLAQFNEEPSRISQPVNSIPEQRTESSYASLGFDQMNNPIKSITKKIAEIANTEVDFRSAKPSKSTSGGFYLKIGNLEISRKKH